VERRPVFRQTLSTGQAILRDLLGTPVNWQLDYCRTVRFNLHRDFSCLNANAIGPSRKRFQSTTEDIENT
jgi:hypothetical protein